MFDFINDENSVDGILVGSFGNIVSDNHHITFDDFSYMQLNDCDSKVYPSIKMYSSVFDRYEINNYLYEYR